VNPVERIAEDDGATVDEYIAEELVKELLVEVGSRERVVLFITSTVEKPELVEEIADTDFRDVVDARIVGTVEDVLNELVGAEVRELDEVVLLRPRLVVAGSEELDTELRDKTSEVLVVAGGEELDVELVVEASKELVAGSELDGELVAETSKELLVAELEDDATIELEAVADKVLLELMSGAEEVLLMLVVSEGVATELGIDVVSEEVVTAVEEATVVEDEAETVTV
jgi:hypothetical protein